jgi:hypothetical protein
VIKKGGQIIYHYDDNDRTHHHGIYIQTIYIIWKQIETEKKRKDSGRERGIFKTT